MSMAYGLQASLNNIDRLFERQGAVSRLGGTAIYAQLVLLDEEGNELSRWPEGKQRPANPSVPIKAAFHDADVLMTSHADGLVTFTCPVSQNGRVQGFVQGWMRYQTLVEYLYKDLPGILVITDLEQIIFQSQPDHPFTKEILQTLVKGQPSQRKISLEHLVGTTTKGSDKFSSYSIFYSTVPGYNAVLYIIENDFDNVLQRHELIFMAGLVILSAGAFGAAALIMRAGSRKLVLETALVEAHKREKAIAEKKEELEFVLEGAQLGTWNWNIASGHLEFNERFCRMLGYEPNELKQHVDTWKVLLHPEDEVHVLAVLDAHLAGLTPFYSTEHRLRHKSGQWIWIQDTGKVLQRDQTGQPTRAFGIHLDITERKDFIRLLANSKEEADTIIRNFLDTLIVVNTSLIIVRVNQATCHLLGYTENELIGRKVFQIFHETELYIQSIFAFYSGQDYQQQDDKQALRNIELCYRHKHGDRLPMSFNLSLLKDDDGTITGVIAGAKDVSGLRLALDKIALQKEYIETIFDIVPEGLLTISPSHEAVKYNRAFKHILDIWSERLGLSPEVCTRNLIAKILENKSATNTFTLPCKHGDTTAYFRCTYTSISILEGIDTVVSIEDITSERKRLEDQKLLATIIEQTDDSVLITGTDGVISYVNPAALKNSGFNANELIGTTQHLFDKKLTETTVLQKLEIASAKSLTWSGHLRNRKKNGSLIEEAVTLAQVRNDEGELTHYVVIKRDFTEMILLQQQLLQAQKLEAIGQLAAGIAHEINTPMQYVQNNVSFLEQAFNTLQHLLVEVGRTDRAQRSGEITALLATIELDFLLEEIPESIKETHDGVNRVVKIVSAMKEFSHPGGNDKVATDLNRALDSTITVCRNEWKYAAEMRTDLDPDLPLVPCFPDQLNQVVLNLIINASHAIQDHNKLDAKGDLGCITIGTRTDGSWVEIHISDTGSGIPEAIQQRIFDPFFTTKEVGRGTGQGLAIAHDIIVNKHGGFLDFTSAPGQGTTFVIRLPIISAQGKVTT
ncbi:MAG: PAS domain S-box protein [Desulfobulbaceae bacterium]|nr:PAS domain S-box protein [Desulfobulbaceae bacterium]